MNSKESRYLSRLLVPSLFITLFVLHPFTARISAAEMHQDTFLQSLHVQFMLVPADDTGISFADESFDAQNKDAYCSAVAYECPFTQQPPEVSTLECPILKQTMPVGEMKGECTREKEILPPQEENTYLSCALQCALWTIPTHIQLLDNQPIIEEVICKGRVATHDYFLGCSLEIEKEVLDGKYVGTFAIDQDSCDGLTQDFLNAECKKRLGTPAAACEQLYKGTGVTGASTVEVLLGGLCCRKPE